MSKDAVIDRRGHPLCCAPIERHEFKGAGFLCEVCHRPRAMHASRDTVAIPSNIDPRTTPIRSPRFSLAMRTHPLTDRDIEKYQAMGYYSEAFREARKELWNRKQSHFASRDGRLIYCP